MAKYIVQHRRGTTTQWASKNTLIPMAGELVIEIDEVNSLHKLKIGDGIHAYADLKYLQAGDEIVTQVLSQAKPRIVTIELSATWNQDADGKYSQTLVLDGITQNSRLDLQPTVDMIAELKQLGVVFVTENHGGTIIVYSVGNMPLKAYTMQATIVETECSDRDVIIGIPVGAPNTGSSGGGSIDSLNADKIIFPNGLMTTYAFGKVQPENGAVEQLIPPGGTLAQVFANLVEEINPDVVNPSISLIFEEAGAYEFGTYVTPTFEATFDAGSYSYGPDTSVTVTNWQIVDTEGNTRSNASGKFERIRVTEDMINADTGYTIMAYASHTAGAIPVTNLGNAYADGQIVAGTVEAISGAITGYRNSFYGTLTSKDALSSNIIRELIKSGRALANGSTFTVDVPVGALRVVVAYPATLRDITSIKDVNGLNAEIKSSFVAETISVAGNNSYKPIDYKVYILDFAEPNNTANKFTVKI